MVLSITFSKKEFTSADQRPELPEVDLAVRRHMWLTSVQTYHPRHTNISVYMLRSTGVVITGKELGAA
jgi:hypothetical protein